ncbi:glycoside hydrolase family 36 protein [Candidatus Binatus sp.]|uniref:glycoside hydrolase family 36 protein n=1 Tax=Candidatus Binatus sp. TaxID=2811406 RepID=UPI00272D34F2|nr:glycoside hydrolase family 36 protein [Candidatus Binatus sp.]
MAVERIKLNYVDADGSARTHALAVPAGQREFSTALDWIEISARIEHALGGAIVRASVANHGDQPIRLVNVVIEVATGFERNSPARFFKHGYQSWSGSGAVEVSGSRTHRRDASSHIARVNHQSEAVRPPEFPEAHTSELFTIVESANSSRRVMVGFIGAATALTTITVSSPDVAIARAILDGVALRPHSHREIEPLIIVESSESASRLAARWADAIGRRMDARITAPHQRGWCSWYHYFHGITEDALRANLKSLESMRADFPIDIVQLDDGFQSALGDWDTTNSKFPSGLKKIAAEIHAAGFRPGIWTAPFLAARDSRVMKQHPDWFIVHETTGEPMRAGYNPNWTTSDDAYAYALDPSNPAFCAHLERVFAKLTRDFGYSYLKLDFLYAAAADGRRHDQDLTRGETLRRGLEAIRAGAGDDALILGCGCPLGQAIGIVDGMRVGPDVSPFWGSTASGAGDPSTVYALDAIIARSFMHRKLWLNDPDCLMLRARETKLTADERAALCAMIAASGGMLLISDDMALLESGAAQLFRTAAEISREIDSDAARAPVLPLDLMSISDVRGLIKRLPHGAIAMLLNRGDSPAQVRMSDLRLGIDDAIAIDLSGGESAVFDEIDLPPHSARIIRATRT